MCLEGQDRILNAKSLFDSMLARPKAHTLRRVGRPRKFWTAETMRKAWEIIQQTDNAKTQILLIQPTGQSKRH